MHQRLLSTSNKDQSVVENTNINKRIYYFFQIDGSSISCYIKLYPELLKPHFMNMFIDTLYVLDIFKNNKPEVIINSPECFIKIKFQSFFINKQQVNSIISLLSRFNELGFEELHENKNALWFYVNSGDEILKVHNYPKSIKKFLSDESILVDNFLSTNSNHYTTFVELGCGKMVNLPHAKKHHLKYVGLDFSPMEIRAAQQQINDCPENYENARVFCLNLFSFDRIKLLFDKNEKVIFFFPFNLFGNIAPISLYLAKIREYEYDLIISNYNTNTETNRIRNLYYSNCGYKNIQETSHETGVVFSSPEGLYTVAYDINYLKKLFMGFGYFTHAYENKSYGYLLFASPLPALSLVDNPQMTEPEQKAANHRFFANKRSHSHEAVNKQVVSCVSGAAFGLLGYYLANRKYNHQNTSFLIGLGLGISGYLTAWYYNSKLKPHSSESDETCTPMNNAIGSH